MSGRMLTLPRRTIRLVGWTWLGVWIRPSEAHAVGEQVIVDLKEQALAHFPFGEFNTNGAWTVLGALAHNLLRWTQLIGLPTAPSAPPAHYAAG